MAMPLEIDKWQKDVSKRAREEFGSESVVTAYTPDSFGSVVLWENDENHCSRWLKADKSGEDGCYYEMLENGKIDESCQWYEVGIDCGEDIEMTGVYVRNNDILLNVRYEINNCHGA